MKRLGADELVATAQLYRAAYDDRLPWLAGRHTAAEDLEFFTDHEREPDVLYHWVCVT